MLWTVEMKSIMRSEMDSMLDITKSTNPGTYSRHGQPQAPLSSDEVPADRISSPKPQGIGAEESVAELTTASSTSDQPRSTSSTKRKAGSEPPELADSSSSKRQKANEEGPPQAHHHHHSLPSAPKGTLSMFLREDFRDYLCRCAKCYPLLRAHPQLLEEEVLYEPPLSETGEGGDGDSMGTGSLLDRGEAALSNVDRVRAIGTYMCLQIPSSSSSSDRKSVV